MYTCNNRNNTRESTHRLTRRILRPDLLSNFFSIAAALDLLYFSLTNNNVNHLLPPWSSEFRLSEKVYPPFNNLRVPRQIDFSSWSESLFVLLPLLRSMRTRRRHATKYRSRMLRCSIYDLGRPGLYHRVRRRCTSIPEPCSWCVHVCHRGEYIRALHAIQLLCEDIISSLLSLNLSADLRAGCLRLEIVNPCGDKLVNDC